MMTEAIIRNPSPTNKLLTGEGLSGVSIATYL